jgi:hypothetical protein
MRQTGRREGLLLTTDPNIVGDVAKGGVASVVVENSAKLVLEVVSAARLEVDSVKIEPSAPEVPGDKVDVASDETASVVAESKVGLVLDIEVDHAVDTIR